jgi:predicted aspartyl protease
MFLFGEKATICSLILAASPLAGGMKLQLVDGRPVLSAVYVNGNGPYRFLVDTGATLNHIDQKLAESIGLRPTFRTELRSSAGATTVTGVEGIAVTLDSVRVDGQAFLFGGMEALHRLSSDIQGVLGQAFLSRFDYLLDFRGKRMEFGGFEAGPTGIRAQFQNVEGRPVVSTSLGSMVLDSGTRWVTLFGVLTGGDLLQMITMTGSVQVGEVAAHLAIDGHFLWRGKAVTVPQKSEGSAAGLLPVSLFKSVYVCNSGGYVILN